MSEAAEIKDGIEIPETWTVCTLIGVEPGDEILAGLRDAGFGVVRGDTNYIITHGELSMDFSKFAQLLAEIERYIPSVEILFN